MLIGLLGLRSVFCGVSRLMSIVSVSVVRTILASLSTTVGGLLLVMVTAGLGIAFYVATTPDTASAPAEVDAVAVPPLVRAAPVTSSPPDAVRIASMALTKPLPTPVIASDRGARVRELQKALARAECYNGPVSGIWSDASKDAMRGFVDTVNAELPVDSPDEALVALVESNDTAKCARGRVISTGTLGPSVQQPPLHRASAEIISAAPMISAHAEVPPQPAPADTSTMLDRAWAPAAMLVPPKATIANATPAAPTNARPPAVEFTADNGPIHSQPDPGAQSASAIHFEANKAVPAGQTADPSTFVSTSNASPDDPQQAKPKKTKTTKRRPAKDDDVQATISKGFDTLQRSLSSMF
jgi:hypothetical protein